MGAGIATLMAGTLPKRINQLFLIEGLGPLTAKASTAVDQLRRFMKFHPRNKIRRCYPSLDKAATVRQHNSAMSFSAAKSIVERGMKSLPQGYYWRHDNRLLLPSPLRLTETQVSSFISQITAPTTLILAKDGYGDYGGVLTQRQKHVVDLSIYQLIGGHHLHMDHPREVANCILQPRIRGNCGF